MEKDMVRNVGTFEAIEQVSVVVRPDFSGWRSLPTEADTFDLDPETRKQIERYNRAIVWPWAIDYED